MPSDGCFGQPSRNPCKKGLIVMIQAFFSSTSKKLQCISPAAIASLYTDATRFAITELSKFSRA